MSDFFDQERHSLYEQGVVDQGDRLASSGPDTPGWSPRRRRWAAIAALVVLVGGFIALLATDDADAPAEPAGVGIDG